MFYENYLELCSKKGKSKTAVAKEIGLVSKSVTGWKNGAIPRNGTLKKLADYFGITVEELMKEENPAGQGGIEDKEMAALMEEWKNRPDAQRKIIKEHLKGMLDMLEDNHEET